MTPDVVVDIGNTRMKFGLCDGDRIAVVATPPPLERGDAGSIAAEFGFSERVRWAVAGVQPERQAEFVAWARGRGDEVTVIEDYRQLPLKISVESPDRVGIDRLLGAVGVNRRRTPGKPALFVDAGSAITVNLIDAEGKFRGGSIAPGLVLMARALNSFTAKLPLVSPDWMLLVIPPKYPGGTTANAILCGLRAAAIGGVRELVTEVGRTGSAPELFVTGGDGHILAEGLTDLNPLYVTDLTLEGTRIAAEALP